MNTHRLFSMHGEYEKSVMRWVKDLRDGIMDANQYLRAYPQHINLIKNRDARRREQQRDYGRTFDWDTAEVLETVCQRLNGRPYPKAILLDSGAFTAWNKGEETTVDDVKRKYSSFIEAAGGLFDEIWGINLDVIPGAKGRDPTPDELKRAVEVSDVNFEILVKEFGNIILPVYHQGEPVERLAECAQQVDGKSNYICVSPRNDLAEGYRVSWSRDAHAELKRSWPEIKTHGLATTGNKMVRTVPWFSGDSAAWVQHGGYGMIDIFHDEDHSFGRKKDPHYMNYFVSFENVGYNLDAQIKTKDGRIIRMLDFGFVPDEKHTDGPLKGQVKVYGTPRRVIADALTAAGVSEDNFPYHQESGHMHDAGKSYFSLMPKHRDYIRGRVEALGFPFEVCIWDSRVRNLICMAEFVTFSEWAKTSVKDPCQTYLLDDL
jgi:hypothetical protein